MYISNISHVLERTLKILIRYAQPGQNGLRREKICLRGVANNKGADQPAHTRSLISAFAIRLLESIISKLATSEFSIFYIVSVAEQAGLNLTLPETPKTGFVATRPIIDLITTHAPISAHCIPLLF